MKRFPGTILEGEEMRSCPQGWPQMKSKEYSHGNAIFSPRQQTLENSILHHLEWTGAFNSGEPTGAIRPDLVPDGPNGFSHRAGDCLPGRYAAQRNPRPVRRDAGRPLESPVDHADC